MAGRLTDWAARAILASRSVDAAFQRFDRLRSRAVLALASGTVLDRFNDLAYGRAADYRPDSESFRDTLFPWEEQVVDRFLPPPPARVLIGGAGGGREAFALAARGHRVVAFEPSSALAAGLARRARERHTDIEVFRARYEDLPALAPAEVEGRSAALPDLGRFSAAILGWGSFSHLKSPADRVATLRAFACVTDGPITVGFLNFSNRNASRARNGDRFSVHIGFYHEIDREELGELAAAAELDILLINADGRDTNWPHAVLRPSRLDQASTCRTAENCGL